MLKIHAKSPDLNLEQQVPYTDVIRAQKFGAVMELREGVTKYWQRND